MAIKTQSDKSKAKRARSWQKNQEAKKNRVAENELRHEHNVKVGSTGKQRANAARKEAKRIDAAFSSPETVEQEDLLEI